MKNRFEQTWRWYGPNDSVSLQDVKQAGATGIVTALHHIAHGDVWPLEDIQERKKIIEDSGLRWSVVESVPVHEAIKTRRSDAGKYIENYKQSLRNLASSGVHIVTYNFMPVLDWTRTKLDLELKNGAKALYFNWTDLAAFDIFVLKREQAEKDYPEEIAAAAKKRFEGFTPADIEELNRVILMGIPSEKDISLEDLHTSLEIYKEIGFEGLLSNLLWFLNEIAEVCEENGIKMAIHPDDPPYPILGLPRIASNKDDYLKIINGLDRDFNGVCFCTGSLGAGVNNNVPEIAEALKHRVHFAHFRNVKKDEQGNFYEADHLDGDVDMATVLSIFIAENQRRQEPIPFRPDHGHQMLDDLEKVTNPGYSAIGRLKGLAEIRGLELGLIRSKV
ncbi:mannonate dehydratase [Sphingobacterium pedocola]|uniref:Mannonate dehydratase n=1 Tax=Sphingobacterium pedocola TaxID=2082722 RepID=A0ABR9T4E0_9SPHI|nr:mannonate dehydratase [Sphingobacterium pedocola]MBE8720209.1 mannonate dehydratase [Sphingobacterium pedocola]